MATNARSPRVHGLVENREKEPREGGLGTGGSGDQIQRSRNSSFSFSGVVTVSVSRNRRENLWGTR